MPLEAPSARAVPPTANTSQADTVCRNKPLAHIRLGSSVFALLISPSLFRGPFRGMGKRSDARERVPPPPRASESDRNLGGMIHGSPASCDDVAAVKSRVQSTMLSLEEPLNQLYAPRLMDVETSGERLRKRVKCDAQTLKAHVVVIEIQAGESMARFNDNFQEIQDACKDICSKARSASAHLMKHAAQETLLSSRKTVEALRRGHSSS